MTTSEKLETVHQLATELSRAFERRNRTNGDEFVCLKDDSPQWMTEVIHQAHGDKMPDDQIYRFCEMAADAIAEADATDGLAGFSDAIQQIEPPVYTHEQMSWFAGNYEYCDEAISEGLWSSENNAQVTDLVAVGMSLHIHEVGEALLQALVEEADNRA